MHSYPSPPYEYHLRSGSSKDALNISILLSSSYYQLIIIVCIATCICLVVIAQANDISMIFNICVISLFLSIIIPLLTWLSLINGYDSSWIVEHENKVIACALVKRYAQYSELRLLHVHTLHRNKGVGSCLVRTVIREIPKPIYLISVPKALYFYTKLGFFPIPRYRLPRRLNRKSRLGCFVLGFISEEVSF
jgi:Acetyltransferase (GNAT) domain